MGLGPMGTETGTLKSIWFEIGLEYDVEVKFGFRVVAWGAVESGSMSRFESVDALVADWLTASASWSMRVMDSRSSRFSGVAAAHDPSVRVRLFNE